MSDNLNSPVRMPARCRPASVAAGAAAATAWIVVLVIAAGLTGAAATKRVQPRSGLRPRLWPRRMWHGGGLMGGSFDPAQTEDRADRMVRHMAIELDATDAQQDKLRAVVKAAVKDLDPDAREGAGGAR